MTTRQLRTWQVPSSDRTRFYTVREQADGTLTCDCPQFVYRCAAKTGAVCKHAAPYLAVLRAQQTQPAPSAHDAAIAQANADRIAYQQRARTAGAGVADLWA